jgi:stress-induced-phosphoprotein 1
MFSDPSLLGKIAGNPTTKHLLADPSFMAKLQLVQKNPKMLQTEIMQDQRLMQVMAMLLGINMSAPGAGGAGEPMDVDPPVSPPIIHAHCDTTANLI